MDLVIVCIMGFFAAFVDSIVGGGGLISIPALLATGMPIHLALGTNKLGASSGAISSVYSYVKSGNTRFELLKYFVPLAVVGSAIGVGLVMLIDPEFLRLLIIFLVAIIGGYTLFNKKLGVEDHYDGKPTKSQMVKGGVLSMGLGAYDGFFGPGTGSFVIFGLIHIFKLDFKRAAANAKAINMGSNLAAVAVFAFHGQVALEIGIPMGICMIFGARMGTHFAVNHGVKFIKPLFVIVSFILVIKMVMDMMG